MCSLSTYSKCTVKNLAQVLLVPFSIDLNRYSNTYKLIYDKSMHCNIFLETLVL
jgi:hypothetical protein